MKKVNLLDPAAQPATKETQPNCDANSTQAVSSMVAAGRTTLSRNS